MALYNPYTPYNTAGFIPQNPPPMAGYVQTPAPTQPFQSDPMIQVQGIGAAKAYSVPPNAYGSGNGSNLVNELERVMAQETNQRKLEMYQQMLDLAHKV